MKIQDMPEDFDFGAIPQGSDSFEILFRWGGEWIGVEVVPVSDGRNGQHYVVRFSNDMVVVVGKDRYGDWVELKEGNTELAKHLGQYMSYLPYC